MKNKVDGTKWNDYLISALRAFRLKEFDLAEERLDKAFAEGGNEIPYLHLLAGHIAHARGIVKEAEKSWKKVIDIDTGNAEAWNNLGVLYRKHGDDEKALAAFQEAAERSPDRPDIPYNIGNLYKSSKDFEKAVTYYNKAIEIDPEYAPAFNNLGTLYEIKKDRNKALEIFRRGLSADSGDASLRFNMGLVYQEEERWDDAREAFDTALKKRPGWIPG
ncbi:MAG: tetratricopeptide repeat protein, partial [Spirochaetaceae bacterium]|nr:tetratricopeptide repeat protein [Spirochaetaceae bacterium]